MTSLRRLRTQRALAVAGLVAVAAPLLSSCGFSYATDEPNVIADGGYHIYGDVHILASRIVAPSAGTGTVVASIAVDANAPAATLTGISGEGLTVGKVTPVEIQPQGMVNLFTEGGIPVTGDFAAGDSVPVTYEFSNGDSIEVSTPVVKQCHEYADVQTQGTKGGGSSPSQTPSTAEPYTCEYPTVPATGEGH
jgi:hypothetical protein